MTATACSPQPLPAASPLDRYLAVEGARLRYRDEGQGPAVVLVHGWTLDLEMWEPQVAVLRAEFRVVRLDRRGHGLSGGIPDTARDADDLAALCAHLGIAEVALVGMSQGARGVLGFAAAAADRVTRLILDGPPSMDAAESDDVPIGEFQQLARSQGIAAFRREWARLPFMRLRTRDTRARALVAAMIERYPGRDLLANPATAAAEPLVERISVPVLILIGEHDSPSRAQAAEFLCARLASARLTVIPDAGHLPNLDQPARYSELCRAFLSRAAPAGT